MTSGLNTRRGTVAAFVFIYFHLYIFFVPEKRKPSSVQDHKVEINGRLQFAAPRKKGSF